MNQSVPISPLSLNIYTRDLWGMFDPSVIAQLAPLASDPCYRIKFYKAPADNQELLPANGYAAYGLKITPGSLIFGFYLPVNLYVVPAVPLAFTVQITDVDSEHKLFTEPKSSLFLSNAVPTFQTVAGLVAGGAVNLLSAPYPVVGRGVFKVDIQDTSGTIQRVELVIGVLEVCDAS
jgi:hypothetical protein